MLRDSTRWVITPWSLQMFLRLGCLRSQSRRLSQGPTQDRHKCLHKEVCRHLSSRPHLARQSGPKQVTRNEGKLFLLPPPGLAGSTSVLTSRYSSVSESTTIEILASRQEAMQTELEGMKRKLDNMTSEVQGAVGKLNRIVPAMISVIGRPDGGAAGKTRSRRGLVTSRSPEKATPKGKERARSDGEGCVDDH